MLLAVAIPYPNREKSAKHGSSGNIEYMYSVISIAVFISAIFLWVIPNFSAVWCTWVSKGIIKSAGENLSHIPKSTRLSFRIIHLRNIARRLQADVPDRTGIPLIPANADCIF